MPPRGFIGERLVEAREARELTAIALSDLIDVSKQAVSKYERGTLEPSTDVLRKLSAVLNLPSHFFYRPIEPHEELGILFWRSLATATIRSRTRAERRYNWLRGITRYLSRYVEFPPIDFPKIDLPHDPMAITDEQIEDAANATRKHWGLGSGPISNVAWLLENKGAVVARQEFSAEKLDAFSEWHPSRHPYIVLSRDKRSASRSRFDAGHELGHLILHRWVTRKQFNTKTVYTEMERQANLFSSAFLLPEDQFSKSFYSFSLDAMLALKSQWRVAVQVIIKRAGYLGLISETTERRAFINLSRRGWRKREPLDDRIEPDEPRFLTRAFELVIRNGIVAPNDIPFQLALSHRDVEEVVGLREGYLSDSGRELKLREGGSSEEKQPEPQILRFPKAN